MTENIKSCFLHLFIFFTLSITCCTASAGNKTSSNGTHERPLMSGSSNEVRLVAKASNASQHEINAKEMWNSLKKRKSVTPSYNRLEKKTIQMDGDIILGGLLRIHDKDDRLLCGPLMSEKSILALEALLYSIDYVNTQKDFLPGIKFGAYILEDCNRDSFSLEQAVDFIRGANSINEKSIDRCIEEYPAFRLPKISGVISATSSAATMQVAKLLELFEIPHVSFTETSPESYKEKFEYFLRTVPSCASQMDAILQIIMRFPCPTLYVMYEDSEYDIQSFLLMEELLAINKVHITVQHKLVKDNTATYNSYYDKVVKILMEDSKCVGVVVFGSDSEISGIMKAVRRNNCTGHFLWIASNALIDPRLKSNISDETMEGVVTLRPATRPVTGFEKYFKSLKVKTNKRNPWFADYWEQTFSCKLPDTLLTPSNTFVKKECSGDEVLSTVKGLEMDKELMFVSDSVLAFAYAIKAMHADLCGDVPGVCKAMKHLNGTMLLNYLKNVSFTGLSGNKFEFSGKGHGPARFDILQVRQESPGEYKWLPVAYYENLELNFSSVQFCTGKKRQPNFKYVCCPTCKPGQVKKYTQDDNCCWRCLSCKGSKAVGNATSCIECPLGFIPSENHTYCEILPYPFMDVYRRLSLRVMTITATGIILLVVFALLFIWFRDASAIQMTGEARNYGLLGGSKQAKMNNMEPVLTFTKTQVRETFSPLDYNGPERIELVKWTNVDFKNNLQNKKY
ncbi:metabotropic glutamate receptor 7 [Nephila pilipes]|uniref:Metabotropic glutamate receptor 7 n=1 Tax=Nephila pilipes TaxID=299642 RepID=A0A8X6PJE0_NEPPI|nr:metabotropic glutamate receptor 7 [Nephila pilipes]